MHRSGQRILIIRLSAIGDVVVTTPVSRALREAFPDAHLAWVVESKAAGFLEGNPFLDEVITWDRPRGKVPLRSIRDLIRRLRARRFDWAIDFQGNLRSGLVARLSGARRIVGNEGAKEHAELFYHVRIPRSRTDLSSRQRCLDLLQPLGIESSDRRMVVDISQEERAEAQAVLGREGAAPGDPYACLVPATTWPQKHWFEERWAELAGLLRGRMGWTAVLMGGPADLPMVERIRSESSGACIVAAGKTSLKTAAAVLEGAQVTIAVDTALMHASVAVGTPTVGVCGASWWPGFKDYERFALVREPMECSPCLHKPTCGGRFDCMRALTTDRVFAAAASLLSGGVVSGGVGSR
jgi:lipopolysaccharide heptosyltransferase I